MPQLSLPTGITIEYETFGSPADPALLLISGFSAQLTSWHENLCKLFAAQNFHVIRFDNRDCGLSTKLDGVVVDTTATGAPTTAMLVVVVVGAIVATDTWP